MSGGDTPFEERHRSAAGVFAKVLCQSVKSGSGLPGKWRDDEVYNRAAIDAVPSRPILEFRLAKWPPRYRLSIHSDDGSLVGYGVFRPSNMNRTSNDQGLSRASCGPCIRRPADIQALGLVTGKWTSRCAISRARRHGSRSRRSGGVKSRRVMTRSGEQAMTSSSWRRLWTAGIPKVSQRPSSLPPTSHEVAGSPQYRRYKVSRRNGFRRGPRMGRRSMRDEFFG